MNPRLPWWKTDADSQFSLPYDMGGVGHVVEVRVNQSSDDAEELLNDGSMKLISGDLEFMKDKNFGEQRAVGMRWTNVTVPPGAIITKAYIRFTTDEVGFSDADVRFYGEASDDAQTFTPVPGNISGRPSTDKDKDWLRIEPWQTVGESGENQQTPDLSGIIQEIIDTDGWQSGNSLVIMAEPLTENTGPRTAESYDGSPSEAPLLHIKYVDDTICNIDLEMVWEIDGEVIRSDPYIYGTDLCPGFRCLLKDSNSEISPACYNEQQADEICRANDRITLKIPLLNELCGQ